jgi:hypothetical protein
MSNKLVENFIFNDDIQDILSQINDNVMDFNILEITGMGTQEIKHSNMLGWLFDDSEHNLEYQILDDFLKKVIDMNDNKQLESLKHYLFLPSNINREITVFREKDNIDLLIVDESNKIVITIENKLYAKESETQLSEYKEKIDKSYNDNYEKYYIFLTINLEKPTKDDYWLIASHNMVAEVISSILKNKEISDKTKIILDSYIDLLKRRGIVEDKTLEKLCEKIWLNKDYAEALNILMRHKTTITEKFYDTVLDKEFKFKNNTPYLQLKGTDNIYEILDVVWSEKNVVFDVTCEYENEDIVLYFSHHKLSEQNENIQDICSQLKKRKSKMYEEIKRYTIDDLINKGEKFVLNDIRETLDNIDETLLSLLKEKV